MRLEPTKNLSSNMNYSGVKNGSITVLTETYLEIDTALYIYGTIVISALIVTFTRSFLFFRATILASRNLHARMFHRILLAPIQFFNYNRCGKMLNRFSKDMGTIDEILPKMLLDAIQVIYTNISGYR